jgi:hypothetical protein
MMFWRSAADNPPASCRNDSVRCFDATVAFQATDRVALRVPDKGASSPLALEGVAAEITQAAFALQE